MITEMNMAAQQDVFLFMDRTITAVVQYNLLKQEYRSVIEEKAE